MTLDDTYFANMSNMEALVLDVDGAANGDSLTGGVNFTSAFGAGAVVTMVSGAEATTVDLSAYSGGVTLTVDSGADSVDTSITTGGGADTISLDATAATTSTIAISSGAGNDTIDITFASTYAITSSDTVTLTGGTGADSITISGLADADAGLTSIVFAAGDSTVTAYDSITGFVDGETTSTLDGTRLDFSGTAVAASDISNVSVTGFTAAELKISSSAGLVSFSGTSSADLAFDAKLQAVIQSFTGAEDTVVFSHGDNQYVFHNETGTDTLVELVDFAGTAVEVLGGTARDGEILIA